MTTEIPEWLRSGTVRAIVLAVMLGTAVLLAAVIGCGNSGVGPAAINEAAEGSTWILQTLDGNPVLDSTYAWLRLDGD